MKRFKLKKSREEESALFQKKMIKKMKKGKVTLSDVLIKMKNSRYEPTKRFCQDLWKIVGPKAEEKRLEREKIEAEEKEKERKDALKRRRRLKKEIERDLKQAAEKIQAIQEQKYPHLKDHKIWRQNRKKFDKIVGMLRNGEMTPAKAEVIGMRMGLINYRGWPERYYQHHAGRHRKRQRGKSTE